MIHLQHIASIVHTFEMIGLDDWIAVVLIDWGEKELDSSDLILEDASINVFWVTFVIDEQFELIDCC